jgi:hypothetical protein
MVGIIKITERTKTVLAGFGRINPSILVRPGSTLRTINPGTARVVAKAVVDQVFDRTFGIYQIPQFLKALARFPDPVLVFDDEVVAIRDGSGVADVIRIPLAQPGKITTPSDQEPRFEVDTTFNLSGAELAWTLKAAQVLSNKHIVITGDEGKVVLWAMDARDPEKHHRTKSVIGNTDRDFRVVLLAANAEKLIPGDYRVEIGYRGNASVIEGIARFCRSRLLDAGRGWERARQPRAAGGDGGTAAASCRGRRDDHCGEEGRAGRSAGGHRQGPAGTQGGSGEVAIRPAGPDREGESPPGRLPHPDQEHHHHHRLRHGDGRADPNRPGGGRDRAGLRPGHLLHEELE